MEQQMNTPTDSAEPPRDAFLDQALAFDLDDRPTWEDLHNHGMDEPEEVRS